MKLGSFDIQVLSDGLFKLDGGGMFGVVPKIMWEKTNPADERNRIELGLNCLLVRSRKHTVLIDTGMGTKWDAKMTEVYDLRRGEGLLGALERLRVKPKDVTHVILSHLHLDHAGGNTFADEDGRCIPTFPRARHIVQRGEWEAATHPDPRSKPSYVQCDFWPVQNVGLFDFIEGETEILPGIRALPTPGHTLHHQSVLIESEGETAIFLADIMPTTSHVRPNAVMGFDLYPLQVMENRERLAERAMKGKWLCVFEHDPQTPLGRIKHDGRRHYAEAVAG